MIIAYYKIANQKEGQLAIECLCPRGQGIPPIIISKWQVPRKETTPSKGDSLYIQVDHGKMIHVCSKLGIPLYVHEI